MDLPHFYETNVRWSRGKEGEISASALPPIHMGTALPFPGGRPDVWSPEHLFVAAINGCLMTTFFAIAENSSLAFESYECSASGKMEQVEGSYMITEVRLKPVIRITHEKDLKRARRIIDKSESLCLVSNSVKTRIVLEPEIL